MPRKHPESTRLEALALAEVGGAEFAAATLGIDVRTVASWQLAAGAIMLDPARTGDWVTVTPDDRQVVFASLDAGLPAVWTVPLDGGTPARLFEGLAVTPHVSPDGRLLV